MEVNGIPIEGLPDSGATVTFLDKECLKFVDDAELQIHCFYPKIRTADDSAHNIVGRVRTEVRCNKKKKVVTFYLLPTLNRSLFLGVDFMKAFGCFTEIYSLSTNDIPLF